MATRRINGTLDTFSVDAGSEITYVGGSTTGNKSDDVRGFRSKSWWYRRHHCHT